ncbi:hypothetical protein [Adonisia turfae]|uniref:Uncharacterized protein n=1 Tax=Adonisia turfae CCMR0081 TaxID=2292702 RepID=A0A6M0REF1_9CYAN|nr:hypothetical protein [Adonisia turfae]NEZ54243.1 hypothetical protein [Adonisia turfae CCMR0081]
MAHATVKRVSPTQTVPRQANCTACLSRNCPMAGAAEYPVQFCNSYRQANCYFCDKSDCALNGSLDSPVMACDQFVPIAI